jgi:hypothetical protein
MRIRRGVWVKCDFCHKLFAIYEYFGLELVWYSNHYCDEMRGSPMRHVSQVLAAIAQLLGDADIHGSYREKHALRRLGRHILNVFPDECLWHTQYRELFKEQS